MKHPVISSTAASLVRALIFSFVVFTGSLAAQQVPQAHLPAASGVAPATTPGLWTDALKECSQRSCNIVIFGDSYSRCTIPLCTLGPEPNDLWVEQLRQYVRDTYGLRGTGILLPGYDAHNNLRLDGAHWASSGPLSSDRALGNYQDGTYPGEAVLVLTDKVRLTFQPGVRYDSIHLYCETKPGSGALLVEIDGKQIGKACDSATGRPLAHRADLMLHQPTNSPAVLVSEGTSYLYGAEASLGTVGVSIHNLSTGGSVAEWFGGASGTQLAFSDLIPGGHQAVAILLLTNEEPRRKRRGI